MLTTTSALPVGPCDWHAEILPVAEMERRLAALRAVLADRDLAGAIVHGGTPEHGALAYFTGLAPKIEPGFALIPRAGPVRVLHSGSGGMGPAAALQTWVTDVRPIGNLAGQVAEWCAEFGGGRCGLVASPLMADALARTVEGAVPSGLDDITDAVDALRRQKSAVERRLIARAAEGIAPVVARLRQAGSNSLHGLIVAAEREGYRAGAEDVRVLASLRPAGVPLVIEEHRAAVPPSFNAYVAVRRSGYWADAHVTVGERLPLAEEAERVLAEALAAGRPPVGKAADGLTVGCHGIGLSLSEAPDASMALQPGDVCSLVIRRQSGNAIGFASALVAVGAGGLVPLNPAGAADVDPS